MILSPRANGFPYRGINAFSAIGRGGTEGLRTLGAQIRRRQKGMRIIFTSAGRFGGAFHQFYTVFNVEQIVGLPIAYYDPELPIINERHCSPCVSVIFRPPCLEQSCCH